MTDTHLPPIFGVLFYSRIQGFAHADALAEGFTEFFSTFRYQVPIRSTTPVVRRTPWL
jgi:hypothetical protein